MSFFLPLLSLSVCCIANSLFVIVFSVVTMLLNKSISHLLPIRTRWMNGLCRLIFTSQRSTVAYGIMLL